MPNLSLPILFQLRSFWELNALNALFAIWDLKSAKITSFMEFKSRMQLFFSNRAHFIYRVYYKNNTLYLMSNNFFREARNKILNVVESKKLHIVQWFSLNCSRLWSFNLNVSFNWKNRYFDDWASVLIFLIKLRYEIIRELMYLTCSKKLQRHYEKK